MALILDETGQPIGGDELALTKAEMAWFAAAEYMCQKFRVNLYCPRCQAKGIPDGLQGRNGIGDLVYAVHCGCSRRTYRPNRPAPAPAPPEFPVH